MAGLTGSHPIIRCRSDIKTVAGEPDMCIAESHTIHYFIAGYKLESNGYVIAHKDMSKVVPIAKHDLEALFESGRIEQIFSDSGPSPKEMALGYSLWIILGVSILYAILKKKLFN